MSKYITPGKDKVPFVQKAAFGAGHLVNNLLPGALGIFMFFLLTAFGMDPFLAGLFTLMMSMTADVCDLDELNNGMPRKEGTFGAIYWWMVKLGQPIALVLGGLVLKLVGFNQNASIQAAETITNLRLADITIPALTAFLAIVVMWKYDLTEQKAREIKDKLVARRGEL